MSNGSSEKHSGRTFRKTIPILLIVGVGAVLLLLLINLHGTPVNEGKSEVERLSMEASYFKQYKERVQATEGISNEDGEQEVFAEYKVSESESKEKMHFYLDYARTTFTPGYAVIISPSGVEYQAAYLNDNKNGEIYFIIDKPEVGVWKAYYAFGKYGTYTCGLLTQEQYEYVNSLSDARDWSLNETSSVTVSLDVSDDLSREPNVVFYLMFSNMLLDVPGTPTLLSPNGDVYYPDDVNQAHDGFITFRVSHPRKGAWIVEFPDAYYGMYMFRCVKEDEFDIYRHPEDHNMYS